MHIFVKTIPFLIVSVLFMACEPGLVDNDPPAPQTDNQEIKTILLSGNISAKSTEWVFSKTSVIRIPENKIDSIIFQAPLRSVHASPAAEAILYNTASAEFIQSSLVSSTLRYTIQNKRSVDLKQYFKADNYSLKIGLRSQSNDNDVFMPYEAKIIIYYQL